VLAHTLIDAIHPLGAMAPWRQAFFDMSWRRWQFWLSAAILSYALIPVLEELIFRGYYQRRLAEDWGDGPAIIGTACFFTFAHRQYLIANVYNTTMIASLLFLAIGLGVVFAWTRSLIPSIIAHAIINVPLTPFWQGALADRVRCRRLLRVASRRASCQTGFHECEGGDVRGPGGSDDTLHDRGAPNQRHDTGRDRNARGGARP
jgi:hypothetical protein